METCDHCGKDCIRRHAVVIDGAVVMVGSACARRFPRAKPSDLIQSLDRSVKSGKPRVLLAKKWTDQDPTGWWVSEKLDGVRALWDGRRLISRLGNEFHAPEWFKKELPSDRLDGELFVGRGRFPETISIVKSFDDKGWSKITYRVFDFHAPDDPRPFEERQAALKAVVERTQSKHLQYVKQTKCKSAAHLKRAMDRFVKLGAEGLMLREPGSRYEPRRSSTLLKVKRFHDAEGKVVGYDPGKGRLRGLMGALVLEHGRGDKRVRFKVGSGFTDAQRRNPPKIGSKVTFRYQEMTRRGVPRFPSFVAARDYEATSDTSDDKIDITPCGNCFQWAYQNLLPGDKLVHATIMHNPELRKLRPDPFEHAWIERGHRVYDWQGVVQRLPLHLMSTRDFERLYKPKNVRRFDKLHAMIALVRSGHYGPWDEIPDIGTPPPGYKKPAWVGVSRRASRDESRSLDPDLIAKYKKLAYAQRGEPEDAMGKVQDAAGGGVLSFVVEHVGDLTNRMAKDLGWGDAGFEYVNDKVRKTLGSLTQTYGFEREHREQMESNARHRGVSLDEHTRKVRAALKEYERAHAGLRVFNQAQWLARQAAIDLGREDFRGARLSLYSLKDMLKNEETWWRHATEYDPKYEGYGVVE